MLRIAVAADLCLSFGGFKGAKSILVPAGEYLYLGSARARQGAVSPGRRLVRHATRSGSLPPHAIREELIARFSDLGLGDGRLLPKRGKRLFWNIDYLLDRTEAEIVGVWLLRCRRRMEAELGQFFERDPATEVIEAGLGANDVPGNTHLLRVHASEDWWQTLADRLASFIH